MKKKRYADGGNVAVQQPTYPFYSNQPQANTTQPNGVEQTFNIQPTASSGQPQTMRKGGYVTKADGCAKRGRTRGKIV